MEIPASYRWLSKLPGDGGKRLLSRRTLLGSGFASLLAAQKPELSSFDLSLIDDSVTPNELFFVREHFPVPAVSSAGWKLSITGAVAKPFHLPYEEIPAQARRILPVTLECAENPVGGGMISHAEWTGLSLGSLLDRAGANPDAGYVRLSGADGFSRTIPVAKALHADTLVVYAMNGEKLPLSHGFPLRALIPGWYGMDSVKWLHQVEVLRDKGRESQPGYTRLNRSLLLGVQPAGPITAMNVKSAFSRPVDDAILVSRRFTIRGAAWAGENRVRQVEVSTDGGKSWQRAQLDEAAPSYSWALWAFEWKIPGPGQYRLSVRAADSQGRLQPAEREAGRADDYEQNAYHTIHVLVR
jgi:DMSO/TMAO reductase YedYZ molybdopterin-dependent catalytic subunit